MSSLGSSRERAQKSSTASDCASGATGYSTSPRTRNSSLLVTRRRRFGQDSSSEGSSGAASTTCSKLSSSKSSSRSPMCSARPSLAPNVCATVSATRVGIAQSGEPDPEDAVPELRNQLGRRLDRQPRLPRATRAGQRHQPRAVPQQLHNVRHLPLPADERRRRPRQIRVRDRLQRRKALLAQLEDPHRLREVLHPVLAKIRQPSVDERARRLRNKHLAAVTGGGDPRRQMDVLADIALPADVRAPGVQAHAHADRTGGQRLLALAGGLDRLGRGRERIEERVPLRVDLHAAVARERLPQQPPVVGERLLIRLRAQLVQQARGPLDVGEEQGDAAGRKLVRTRAMIIRRQSSSVYLVPNLVPISASHVVSQRTGRRQNPTPDRGQLPMRGGRFGRTLGP